MASSVFPLCNDWYPSMFSTNSSGLFFGSLEFFSSSYFRSIASVPFSFATNSSCRAVDRSSGMYFHPYSWATLRRTSRSEEHTSELQSHSDLVCRLLLEKKKKKPNIPTNNL